MSTQTPQDTSRTFEARITSLYSSKSHRTVVAAPGQTLSSALPLTDVTVALRPGELFMAAGANGQTGYFADLGDALTFARNTGSAGTPGAIVILSPCMMTDGITGFNIYEIHERAKAAPGPVIHFLTGADSR